MNSHAMKSAIKGRHDKGITLKISIGHDGSVNAEHMPADGGQMAEDASAMGEKKGENLGLAPDVLDAAPAHPDVETPEEELGESPAMENAEDSKIMGGIQAAHAGRKPNLNQRAKQHMMKMFKKGN
jgi:hypothetical protein